MKPIRANTAYFSAAYTTRNIVRQIATATGLPSGDEYDFTQVADGQHPYSADDLVIVGVPVYAGRVPAAAIAGLSSLKGDGAPAIAVVVYGNRDYDDAMLELCDLLHERGFRVVAAGAFIARHSIFPQVATERPDQSDQAVIREFAAGAVRRLGEMTGTPDGTITVKGNRPYKTPGSIPLKPRGNRQCNDCGTCVRLCPAGAIPQAAPRTTDKAKCFSCGRCIVVCPRHARHFGGLAYKLVRKKFVKAYSARREPELFYL